MELSIWIDSTRSYQRGKDFGRTLPLWVRKRTPKVSTASLSVLAIVFVCHDDVDLERRVTITT
jgi:hypothetical protein